MEIEQIAYIENDFREKFGIPRQSGLVKLRSRVVFTEEYSDENAFRGLEEFSHIWIIWGFSGVKNAGFSPTVRPPRLGGNVRRGVFATRSPYRPNPLGLSVVRLCGIKRGSLEIEGADMMNGTPVYDVKPYLPYVDSIPEALNGFALSERAGALTVDLPAELLGLVPEEKREGLAELLAQDPRPQYQNDSRVYTMSFGDLEISFRVSEKTLTVTNIRHSEK